MPPGSESKTMTTDGAFGPDEWIFIESLDVWRGRFPTVMSGLCYRFRRNPKADWNEISVSREGVTVKWEGVKGEPGTGQLIAIIAYASGCYKMLLRGDDPFPES